MKYWILWKSKDCPIFALNTSFDDSETMLSHIKGPSFYLPAVVSAVIYCLKTNYQIQFDLRIYRDSKIYVTKYCQQSFCPFLYVRFHRRHPGVPCVFDVA